MKKENVVVTKFCHSRFCRAQHSGVFNTCCYKTGKNTLLNRYVEDPRYQLSGMTPYFRTTRGFTLIELLIVVLIIGILTAIAVPQYQLAIDKSRTIPYIQLAKQIIRAQQVYFLDHGKYANTFDVLDIDATKLCPITAGSAHYNELRDCVNRFSFNIPSDATNLLRENLELLFCKQSTCNWQSEKHMMISFSLKPEKKASCGGYTARGKRLCTWFLAQF